MKVSIFLFFLFFAFFNLWALEFSDFESDFSNVSSFEKISLSKIKNYFENINSNSIVFVDKVGNKTFKFRKDRNDEPLVIHTKILRDFGENSITETLIYSLDNSSVLSFIFKRTGKGLLPTEDLDLLLLRFKVGKVDSYVLQSKELGIYIEHLDEIKRKISTINIIGFEFYTRIESKLFENNASLTFSFYSPDMASPQSSLMVFVNEDLTNWNPVSYKYYSSQKGELTPALFNTGIIQAISAYEQASAYFLKLTHKMGFPKLE
jgi:hypothetical protein